MEARNPLTSNIREIVVTPTEEGCLEKTSPFYPFGLSAIYSYLAIDVKQTSTPRI